MVLVLLKGHQIIGELRPAKAAVEQLTNIERSPDHWWVTTLLVRDPCQNVHIERSPDHWWVTTTVARLRLDTLDIERSPDHWWVTTAHETIVRRLQQIERSPDHWWVTTYSSKLNFFHVLIERSPDHWWVTTRFIRYKFIRSYWKVTRSLVSYDFDVVFIKIMIDIERSPDHWWVTTFLQKRLTKNVSLKGHQIIGELRHNLLCGYGFYSNWKVTRSLVSYDFLYFFLHLSLYWKVTRSLVSYDKISV